MTHPSEAGTAADVEDTASVFQNIYLLVHKDPNRGKF